MIYTLNQLRIFLKVAQAQSVTRASEELNLTQPAVSIQLKNFQNQFDIPLTEVIGRRIYITDFGKEIADAAELILDQVSEINNKALSYKGLLTGRLKISVVSTGKYIMPYFLSDFMKQHPGIELVLDVSNKDRVIGNLENNEVDFSLVSVVPDKLSIEKIELLPNKLFLVGSESPNVVKGKALEQIFNSLSFIYREKGSGTRQLMERFLEKNNLSISKKLELTSNEAVKQSIIAGLGYSIMPLIGVKNELLNGQLKIIPVKGLPIKTSWSLVWNKDKKHSAVATKFLAYLKAEKINIAKSKFAWYEEY